MKTNLPRRTSQISSKKWMVLLITSFVLTCGISTYLVTTRIVIPPYPNISNQDQPINRYYTLLRRKCFGIHVQNIRHGFTDDPPEQVIDYFEQAGIPVRDSYPHGTNLYRDSKIWVSNFYYRFSNFISVGEIENSSKTSLFSQTDFYVLLFSTGPHSIECRH